MRAKIDVPLHLQSVVKIRICYVAIVYILLVPSTTIIEHQVGDLFLGQSCFFLKACSFLPFENAILIKFICITVLPFVMFHVFVGSTSTVHCSFLCIMFFFTAKCNIIYGKYPVSLSHWQGIQFVPLLTLVFYYTYTFTGMYIYIYLFTMDIDMLQMYPLADQHSYGKSPLSMAKSTNITN